jgi:hypothetical protein
LREIFSLSDGAIACHFYSHDIPEIIIIEQKFQDIRQKSAALSLSHIVNLLFLEFDLLAKTINIQGNFCYEIQKEFQRIAVEATCGADFLFRLKNKSQEIYQSEWIDRDAIQLYTFHKAKGLEWPIVIIPFVNRKQMPAPHTFPDVVAQKIAINKRQYEEWSDSRAYVNNLERLLYVALTRQKQQTIFIDDGGEGQLYASASILQFNASNRDFFQNLPRFQFAKTEIIPNRGDLTISAHLPVKIQYKESEQPVFAVRTPSQSATLSRHRPRCKDPLAYGNWWHEAMLQCLFKSYNVVEFLHSIVGNAPDMVVARLDVEKLIQNTFFWQQVAECEQMFCEYPFFVCEPDCVLEGRVDLLFKSKNSIHFVDWKTEHVDDLDNFVAEHTCQMYHYRDALCKIFPEFFVKASIYATECGQFIDII